MITSYWDHSTKPSTFVVKSGKEEIYRGPFVEGYKIYQEKRKIIVNDNMKPRITRVTIVKEGEPLFSQHGYTIEIEDEAAGEFIQITDHQDCNKITLNPEDWPSIRSAINKMVKLCK